MEIEHIKNQGVTGLDHYFPRYGAVTSLVTNFDQTRDRSIAWEIVVQSCDPLVFDVFYLHKYSHSFSNFIDIIIQFFQKTSVMTVATLVFTS